MTAQPARPARICLALPYPADLRADGAIEQLLAVHAAVLGHVRMEGDGGDDAGGGDSGGDGGDDAGDGDPDDDDKDLGPKGEKALAAEKTKRRAAQAEAREFKNLGLTPAQVAEFKALGMTPAELKELVEAKRGAGGDKPDVDRIKADAKTEAQTELLRERVLDKIEAKAARLFRDPDDAAALLLRSTDHNDYLDDGKIDVEAIEDGLKDLLEKKPYLGHGAQGDDGSRFKGGADGGARKESKPKPTSLEAAVAARIAGNG